LLEKQQSHTLWHALQSNHIRLVTNRDQPNNNFNWVSGQQHNCLLPHEDTF